MSRYNHFAPDNRKCFLRATLSAIDEADQQRLRYEAFRAEMAKCDMLANWWQANALMTYLNDLLPNRFAIMLRYLDAARLRARQHRESKTETAILKQTVK